MSEAACEIQLTMNYYNTFIAVSPDTKAKQAAAPPERGGKKSIANLEYELIAKSPYKYTQEEVQFNVHLLRSEISTVEAKQRHQALWDEFFAKSHACMRTSPLAKTYGWGLHFNPQGKVALVAMESKEYQRLACDRKIQQTYAVRSRRA